MYRCGAVRTLLWDVRDAGWDCAMSMCCWVDGQSVATVVVSAVMVALWEGLAVVAALLFPCESCVSLPSGGIVDNLLSRGGDTLGPVFWTGGSLVTGVSTRYLVGLLLNAA